MPTLSSALFGQSWASAVLNTKVSSKIVGENLLFIAYSFPTPNIVLFIAGLYGIVKASPGRLFNSVFLAVLASF